MAGAGFESRIDIYLRMRPIEHNVATYEFDHEEGRIQWVVPRHIAVGMVNHQRERYNFTFNGILDTECKQDVVFETVGRKVVLGALDGFNGTIFAYGQTGSGKTYTITGGAERYVDRGIIPRAISLIFSELANRSDHTYTIHFSYMEIYNETGYDLLNPDHETKALEDLPKVVLLEDDDNQIHLRNLSTHLAINEEEALNLLFMGDTNRMISSTPMNMASSRSHCIFTASIEARKAGEDTVRKSKLHLVDLAGSERVSKTGVDGQILKEAKYINLSLHFLEQVIIALQEVSQGKIRSHIPYRNSMMTSVLRDSIGGNCRTVMIANVSISQEQLEETISTCRFAQRVAMVSNQVMLNEEVDPNIVIKRLKQEVKDLKAELQLLRGDDADRDPLTETELTLLRNQVSSFVNDTSPEASLNCGGNMVQIRAAFHFLKEMASGGGKWTPKPSPDTPASDISGHGTPLHETIQNLHHQLQQRDNEINILVSFIRKRESSIPKAHAWTQADSTPVPGRTGTGAGAGGRADSRDSGFVSLEGTEDVGIPSNSSSRVASSMDSRDNSSVSSFTSDRKQAFELFWKNYPSMDAIEENKSLLKSKYTEAKSLGEKANKAREVINDLKARIEKRRVERAMDDLVNGKHSNTLQTDPEEEQLISVIENEKRNYKEGFNKLRDLKREIEHLHLLLEQSRTRVQADFEQWFNAMCRDQQSSAPSPISLTSTSDVATMDQRSLGSDTPERSTSAGRSSDYSSSRNSPAVLDYLRQYDSSHHESQMPVSSRGQKTNHLIPNSRTALPKQQEALIHTGNMTTDADIAAFYKARSQIMRMKSHHHHRQPSR